MSRGNMSSDRRVTDLRSPVEAVTGTDKRVCESCGGAIPPRTHRQRNAKGQLVCDSCADTNAPSWTTTHGALSVLDQSEMRRREAEAITSIVRVRKAKHAGLSVVAHDSGDNAIVNHCPFCGSGAVVGRSDGTITCEFCHTSCTVQVQPAHPFTPQTIDGQPITPPGLPGGEETELSAPLDPTVNEEEEGVNEDALGDADPTKSNGPVAPGQPKSKQPPPFTKADPSTNPGKGEDGAKPKKKSLPPWMDKKKSSTRPTFGPDGETWLRTAVQTSDPNSREEHPYPDMGDYVVIADAIRRFIRAGIFPTYEEAKRSGIVDRLKVPGIQSNLTTEEKVQEVLAEAHKFRTSKTADTKGSPEYKKHYQRGWAAGGRGSGLDSADARQEPDAWYDGYMDAATDRPKWTLMHHENAEAAEKALDEGWTPPSKRSFRTATGATLDEDAYMAHLALGMADDRGAVLDAVRLEHSGE